MTPLKTSYLILLEVAVTFIFLIIFYFTYVVTIEEKNFERQIQNIVSEVYITFKPMLILLPESTVQNFKQQVEVAARDKLRKIKPRGESKNNQKLVQKGLVMIAITMIFIAVITGIAYRLNISVSVHDVVHYGIITVIVAAITEFFFLQVIASKYMAVDMQDILQSFGTSLSS